MDAANTTTLKRTALFLSIALLLAAPFRAQAQSFVFPQGAVATMNGNQPGCTQVNSSGAPITFSSTQVFVSGDPQLAISPNPATTNTQLCFSLSNVGGVTSGTHTMTINLASSSPSGITGSITVTWNPNSGSGGGGNTGAGLTANVSSLGMTSFQGAYGTTSFTLTNSTNLAISFSTSATYSSGSGWLIFPGSGTVPALGTAQVNIQGNPTGLANAVYSANLVINYSGGGSGTITLPVQFSVGSNSGGSGSLSMNPNPVNLNYTTGSNVAPSQLVTLSTSASTYDASVTTGTSWLLVNGQSRAFGAPVANGLSISTILSNLPTANSSGTIQVTDSNGNSGTLSINFTVNGQSNGLTISPSPVTLNAAVGQTTQAQATVTISSTAAGSLSVTPSGTGISAQLLSGSIAAGGTAQMVIYGNPAGLAGNTYQGSVTVTLNGTTSTVVNVNFVVGGTTNTGIVAPTSLQFAYQTGTPLTGSSSSLVPQFITEGVSGTFSVTGVTGSWLSVTPTNGAGPTLLTVSANAQGLSAGTYNGSFVVNTVSGSQTVTVTLLVTANAVVYANPAVINLSYTAGSANPSTTVQMLSSDGSSVGINAGSSQAWLTVSPANANTNAAFFVSINASSLPNGVNVGNLSFNSTATNSPVTVPVVVTVSGSSSSGTLTLGTSSLTFNATVNGSAPASQNLSISAPSTTSYTATVSSGASWLSIQPSGSLNTTSYSGVTVSANQSGLAAGTYNGNIILQTGSGTQTVQVTLVVSSAPVGSVQSTPSSLSFSYQSGGSTPASQTLNITGTGGFTVGTSTQSGGSWLSTNVPASSTLFPPYPVIVSVTPTGLAAGTYTGSVVLTPTGGSAVNVPVTLTVQGLPTVSASPTSMTLTYLAGSSNAPTGTLQVSGSAANLNFTANASSSGWLSVTPASGNTGANGTTLTVGVNPSGLLAGTFTGTITVAGTNGATGSTTTTVTLTVTAPLPTISGVANAASGAIGPVSPGEIVSIFAPASNPIGPSTPASTQIDPTGNFVTTSLGGVQVLFNGFAAPLTYVSATQINCVVPYGIAGLFAPFVQVKYLGQPSNPWTLSTTSTAPGIFTQNGSGTGPGAILNQDFSVNGPATATTKPAAKGSTIQVFMTGEGSTAPAGITGKINCPAGSACSISQLPVPLLPVTVTFIDSNNVRYPANYSFAGEAPGFVSGVLQVNAQVPPNVPSGNLQIVIGVGSNSSQTGVTVSVQ